MNEAVGKRFADGLRKSGAAKAQIATDLVQAKLGEWQDSVNTKFGDEIEGLRGVLAATLDVKRRAQA